MIFIILGLLIIVATLMYCVYNAIIQLNADEEKENAKLCKSCNYTYIHKGHFRCRFYNKRVNYYGKCIGQEEYK